MRYGDLDGFNTHDTSEKKFVEIVKKYISYVTYEMIPFWQSTAISYRDC